MKWWFSDYDGTLHLNHSEEINKKDLNFIKKWISNGNKFGIASGRTANELNEIFDKYNIKCDYFICNNGALVYDGKNELISATNIPMDARTQIVDMFEKYKNEVSLGYCLGETRMAYSFVPSSDETLDKFLDSKGLKVFSNPDCKTDILTKPDLNLLYIFSDAEKIQKLKPLFENILGCKLLQTHYCVLEVMHEDVSKAHGIEQIQAIHNFKDHDIVASGDGQNDIEMLQKANHAFVMQDHQPNVNEYADHLIAGVHEIEKYI